MISTERPRGWVAALADRARGRVREAAWRIALSAVTATAAWVIAQHLLGQRAPIFAPIAAVVCLTDAPGVRGRRAVRLLGGVLVGVAVGEASAQVIGTGWLQIGVSLAVGMLVVSLASVNSLTLLQAGIAALLVVGTASPQTGWTRLFSALIGGLLALLVSQVLAAPDPTRLLGDAAARALGPPRRALVEAAAAMREGSATRVKTATEGLRAGHATLAEFIDARSSADSIARTTARGRRRRRQAAQMQDRFSGIEYVYAGSVLLTRTATELVEADEHVPDDLVVGVETLAAALKAIADDPQSADTAVAWSTSTNERRAGELAASLIDVNPDRHEGLTRQLVIEVHLLAETVAALAPAPDRSASVD